MMNEIIGISASSSQRKVLRSAKQIEFPQLFHHTYDESNCGDTYDESN